METCRGLFVGKGRLKSIKNRFRGFILTFHYIIIDSYYIFNFWGSKNAMIQSPVTTAQSGQTRLQKGGQENRGEAEKGYR